MEEEEELNHMVQGMAEEGDVEVNEEGMPEVAVDQTSAGEEDEEEAAVAAAADAEDAGKGIAAQKDEEE